MRLNTLFVPNLLVYQANLDITLVYYLALKQKKKKKNDQI